MKKTALSLSTLFCVLIWPLFSEALFFNTLSKSALDSALVNRTILNSENFIAFELKVGEYKSKDTITLSELIQIKGFTLLAEPGWKIKEYKCVIAKKRGVAEFYVISGSLFGANLIEKFNHLASGDKLIFDGIKVENTAGLNQIIDPFILIVK